MTERALVTGGGGFLGRSMVRQLLARGDAVTVFSRGAYPDLAELGVRIVRGDLRDAEAVRDACRGVDLVYHVAAKAGLWGDWDDFHSVNVTGTDHVIAACRHHQIPRLVYTSSPSVVFDGTDQAGVDETYPYPACYESPYPATKAMAEQRVLASNDPDLRTISLRPHLIFGPGDNHLLPALIERAKCGRVPQVGDGTNRVDLTYVEDAARAHLLAAEALHDDEAAAIAAGQAYFISQDEPVVLWSWIGDLLAQLDLPAIRLRLGLAPARSIGAVLAGLYQLLHIKRQPPLTPFLASELAQSHYYDITRVKRDLGYRPAYTMAEATAATIAWLQQTLAGGVTSKGPRKRKS
jgi:nucleoside-diphosphate-sugar epimerase